MYTRDIRILSADLQLDWQSTPHQYLNLKGAENGKPEFVMKKQNQIKINPE